MTKNFDFHDTISVVIPGACAWCLFVYLKSATWKECVDVIARLSVGGTVIFLGLSYIVGELLQAMGKFILQTDILSAYVDDSYQKVVDENVSVDDCRDILPPSKCAHLREYLRTAAQNNDVVGNFFYSIKLKVYSNDVFRTECIKMLTKMHFFSTMMALFIMAFIFCGAIIFLLLFSLPNPECASQCRLLHYVGAHFDIMHCFLLLLILGMGIYGTMNAYRTFNQHYARCLFSSYLEIMAKEEK